MTAMVLAALWLAAAAQPSPESRRSTMVREQIEARGVKNPRVLAAMREVPREQFMPAGVRDQAYADQPAPIGFGAKISQPYIVAFMTEQLGWPRPTACSSGLPAHF
jgi:protein-L-isoaspartate(D-aspartate) O-methyltransferase